MIANEKHFLNAHAQYHVLIVEDDLFLKTILERVLGSIDPMISYTWVTTAEEARTLLQEVRFSLVIADFGLSGKQTGLDLWNFCKLRFESMPFLLTSSMSAERLSNVMGEEQPSPAFMPKPFRADESRQTIRQLLS